MVQDQEWGRFYRISGILLFLGLLGALANVAIFAAVPAPGTGVEGTLEYSANNQLVYWIGIALFGMAIPLLLPAIVAVCLAQRGLGQASMLLAALSGVAGILVFVSLLPVIFSLPVLGQAYVTATGDAQRAAYLAAGNLALSEVTSGLVVVVFLLAIWTVISSAKMTKGVLGKRLGQLGMVTGIGFIGAGVNIVFPTPGLDFVDALSILWIGWLFGVGYRLFKLGQPAERFGSNA